MKLNRIAAAAALATCMTVTACSSTAGSSGDEDGSTYKIGFAVGLTGFMQQFDEPYVNAGKMAIEDINAAGGVNGHKLEAIVADTRSTPDGAATAALSLVDKGADFVVISGDFDAGAPAAVEVMKAGIVAFSAGAGSTKFGPLGLGPLAYTMSGAAPAQGALMAEYAASQGATRVATLLDTAAGDFSKQICEGFRARFEELGDDNQVVEAQSFEQTDQSLATQATKLRGAQPDGVMICSYMPGAANAIRQLRAAGVDATIYGQQDFDGDAWKDAIPNVSDVTYPAVGSIYGDDPDPEVNAFFTKYEEEFGAPKNGMALQGYAVIQAFSEAVAVAGGTEGAALSEALNGFEDTELLVGPTTFTDTEHIRTMPTMRIMSIDGGKTTFTELRQPTSVPEISE